MTFIAHLSPRYFLNKCLHRSSPVPDSGGTVLSSTDIRRGTQRLGTLSQQTKLWMLRHPLVKIGRAPLDRTP